MKKIFLLLCLVGAIPLSRAQNYSIGWHKIAGGGGTGAGGNYSVSGTIGLHDASGALSGGPYSITGDFWSLTQAVQTPGVPTLYISSVGNTVTIYWQDVAGWSLQQSGDLTSPAGWTANNGYSLFNGTNYLPFANPPGNLFYRLIHP